MRMLLLASVFGDDVDGSGSASAPLKTLGAAFARASAAAAPAIYVSSGTYVEPTLVWDRDVSLYGGFESTRNW